MPLCEVARCSSSIRLAFRVSCGALPRRATAHPPPLRIVNIRVGLCPKCDGRKRGTEISRPSRPCPLSRGKFSESSLGEAFRMGREWTVSHPAGALIVVRDLFQRAISLISPCPTKQSRASSAFEASSGPLRFQSRFFTRKNSSATRLPRKKKHNLRQSPLRREFFSAAR